MHVIWHDLAMRILAATFCIALAAAQAKADPLTAADREALLEQLEKLRETADSKVDARFRLAIAAFRGGLQSDDAAMDLYLKCIEKVNFEDQLKKNADFRDWKRKEADRLADASFRLALRYQLRWLVLTLMASSADPDLKQLADEAQDTVDSIFRDADKLESQGPLLGQAVTTTVFARAYEIGGLDNPDWPLSPVQLEQVYSKIIFPRYRSPDRVETLRAAWIRRIQQEGIKIETLSGNRAGRKNGLSTAPQSPEEEKFNAETVPELQWEMEKDLFRSGDETASAMRMLQHIEKHISHRSARDWSEEFQTLLRPIAPPVPAKPAEPAP
jgi:hypothetical protein